MSRNICLCCLILALASWGLASGCIDLNAFIPGSTWVTIEVVNDTDFEVDANIRLVDSTDSLTGLGTGVLTPSTTLGFQLACDEISQILSDNATQIVLRFDDTTDAAALFQLAEATDSKVLRRGEHFDCGDVIRLVFTGNGEDFGVVVSVNGSVVN